MKVILSRKGFDGEAGGYPSPILPNGEMQSLPIPSSSGNLTYSQIKSRYKDFSLYDLMREIKPKYRYGDWISLGRKSRCHFDPDLDRNAIKRDRGWRGCFGQINAAQAALHNASVGQGDLFLFFGWFQFCDELKPGHLLMRSGNGVHAIFGYLQIDSLIKPGMTLTPTWMRNHPHADYYHTTDGDENNTIYAARRHASWNPKIPGYGVFRYSPELILTKQGLKKSQWQLPDCFRNAKIKYHSAASWKDGYFQSAARGQEFVVDDNEEVAEWAKGLVNRAMNGG